MNMPPRIITICGGGSLGHICLGVLGSQANVTVQLLTQQPSRWQSEVRVTDLHGKEFVAPLHRCTDQPAEVIPQSDMVLLCLPGFAIAQTLRAIRPYLAPHTVVGSIVSSTGFFFFAHDILPSTTPLFGFQRTPFIARTHEYGSHARLLGYKKSVAIACERVVDAEIFRAEIAHLFLTPTVLLHSYFEAALTNSNPILHTARLYTLWHNWEGTAYDRPLLFYREWTAEAAQLLIEMDEEFMRLLQVLPVTPGAIPPLLTYYESHDAPSLAAKLRSIEAFQTITAPMRQTQEGWVPDFQSRYFTEDFPYGLRWIVELATQHQLSLSRIFEVYAWGCSKLIAE